MRIIVIDDDKLVALSLKTILEGSGSITVAAMGSSGQEAIELYRANRPDVMLMDIRMEGMTGIEVIISIICIMIIALWFYAMGKYGNKPVSEMA